jgi:hydroxyacylglutathione hydrolase
MLKVEPIPAFQDNYIWAIHDGHSAAVVDPGEAEPVERFLAQRGLALGAIVITHHHGDHQGGVADLLARHPRPDGAPLPVIGPPASASATAPRPCARATR